MREERQERQATIAALPIPLIPQLCPFDLDAEASGKQLIKDDQETLLAELIVRQRLEVLEPTFEEPTTRPRVDNQTGLRIL